MPIGSLVVPIRDLSTEIRFFQGSGHPESPCIRCCPKAMPFSFLNNSQFPTSTEVSLCILKPGCSELPIAYHINSLISIGKRHPCRLGSHVQYQVHLGPLTKHDTKLGCHFGAPLVLVVLQALLKERYITKLVGLRM
jgi:hypothetical protein